MRFAVESERRAGELNGAELGARAGGAPQGEEAACEAAAPVGEPTESGAAEVEETRAAVTSGEAKSASATHHHHGLPEAIQSLLYVMVIALFIVTFIVQPFRIPSESMEPTLLVGDFLLVDKQVGVESEPLAFVPTNAVHRGDLIVFHFPVDASLHLVKRVIGVPGDHVHLRDGHAYVNGRALAEPYAMYVPAGLDAYRDDFPHLVSAEPGVDSRWWIQMHTLVANGELTVPAGNYFVLGDNRNDSEDSRYWGLVPQAAIVGKPFLIYFSLNNAGATPGQASAAAMQGDGGNESEAVRGPLARFARWKRALRIIR